MSAVVAVAEPWQKRMNAGSEPNGRTVEECRTANGRTDPPRNGSAERNRNER